MRLKGLTVCVNFQDYLLRVIDNRDQLDSWLIVTTEEDKETQAVCEDAGLHYTFTRRLYEANAPFNKGKAINDGLDRLSSQGWVVIIDADTLLPRNFRKALESREMNPHTLYGCNRRRVDINGEITLRTEGPWRTYPDTPILGFLQIFHSYHGARYPEQFPTAAESDLAFNARFDDCVYIEDLVTTHFGRRNRFHAGRPPF